MTRVDGVRAHATAAGLPGAGGLELYGTVSPALRRGSTLLVQRLGGRRWQTVGSGARLARGGSYDVSLPGPGRYRVLYAGLRGPAVWVG
jgi:hypothetical protein